MADDVKAFSTARVELDAEDLKKVKGLKVGSKVRLVLYGTLNEMHLSASDVSTDSGAQSGTIQVALSEMKVADNSELASLFDEEFDG